jgi:hypothetical protein
MTLTKGFITLSVQKPNTQSTAYPCSSSLFNYSPAGHIAGDVDIVENKDLKSLIRKGNKSREHQSFKWEKNCTFIINAVKDYAKRWAEGVNEELDTLSEWVKSICGISKSRSRNIKTKVRTIYLSVFHMQQVRNEMKILYEEFVFVPADKACNNIVFVKFTIITVS